jgi:rhodanese-related sulfurtransferase
MKYSPAFDKLVSDAKAKVTEISAEEVHARRARGESFVFLDIREESEFAAGRIVGAKLVGRGILERDIEALVADHNAEVILYCGGGGRSALSAESLMKMGYTAVKSMAGGFRGWVEKGYPAEGVALATHAQPASEQAKKNQ